MQIMAYLLDREKLRSAYDADLPILKKLEQEAVHEINFAINKTDLKVHSVKSRVKEFDSLCDKATRKEFGNPLVDARDLVGIRVVALFLGDVDKIIDLLKKALEVVEIDDKLSNSDPAKFGYLSIHMHAKFPSHYAGTHYDNIKNKLFEIQVRTIAMDAWASASHYLDYKSEDDIPSDLKRDFHALSGLYYVADKHFEMFFRSRQASVKEVQKLSKTDDFLDQEINLDTLTAYLRRKYSDRKQGDSASISVLVTSLRTRNFQSLRELDKALDEKSGYLSLLEKKNYPKGDGEFNSVGAVRISFANDPLFEPDHIRPELPNFTKQQKQGNKPKQK